MVTIGNTAVTRKGFIWAVFGCISLHGCFSRLLRELALESLFYGLSRGGEGGIRTHGSLRFFGFQDHSTHCK